jgi:hypothetical protein
LKQTNHKENPLEHHDPIAAKFEENKAKLTAVADGMDFAEHPMTEKEWKNAERHTKKVIKNFKPGDPTYIMHGGGP